MLTEEKVDIMYKAIETYGTDKQVLKTIEEMSELTKELCKRDGSEESFDRILEEMVDVQIMLNELAIIFNYSGKEMIQWENKKFTRLKNRLESGE